MLCYVRRRHESVISSPAARANSETSRFASWKGGMSGTRRTLSADGVPGMTTRLHNRSGFATHSSLIRWVALRSAVDLRHGRVPSSISTRTYSHDHKSSRRPRPPPESLNDQCLVYKRSQ